MQLEMSGTVRTISQKGELKVLVIIELHQENPDQPQRPLISPINQPLERQISDSIQMAVSAIPIAFQQVAKTSNEVNWLLTREEYMQSGLCVGDKGTLILSRP